jgi:hypothetical protein
VRLLLIQTSRMLQGCSSCSTGGAKRSCSCRSHCWCRLHCWLPLACACFCNMVSQASQIQGNLPQHSLLPQKQWNFCSLASNGAVRDIIGTCPLQSHPLWDIMLNARVCSHVQRASTSA